MSRKMSFELVLYGCNLAAVFVRGACFGVLGRGWLAGFLSVSGRGGGFEAKWSLP